MKKRSDGRYQLSIMVGYNDNGTPKRKVVYGATQKEVNEKANTLRMQSSMGLRLDNNITVGEWADTWFDSYKSGVGYNSRRMYRGILDKYIIPTFGLRKLKDIKTAHLQKIVNDNADKPRAMEQFKLTTSQLFKQAIANDIVFKNPTDGVILPKAQKKQTKRALTADETKHIALLKLDLKTKFLVYLLMYTGMRKGEALALSRSDVDFDSGEITVNKSLLFMKNKSEIKMNPKTEAGTRTIPILEPLKPILRDYLASVKSEQLFTTKGGELFTVTAYRRIWEKFTRTMETKEITAHIFRHNFATTLYYAGVDVKTAQAILGHKSVTVTLGIYTHLDSKKKTEAAAKLNEYVSTLD
ncbi:MAG: site-specific integrase [Defluviitaleaceae bacterium]|nr:site-specific integrase [Defluviitaleaceae bacterium]